MLMSIQLTDRKLSVISGMTWDFFRSRITGFYLMVCQRLVQRRYGVLFENTTSLIRIALLWRKMIYGFFNFLLVLNHLFIFCMHDDVRKGDCMALFWVKFDIDFPNDLYL